MLCPMSLYFRVPVQDVGLDPGPISGFTCTCISSSQEIEGIFRSLLDMSLHPQRGGEPWVEGPCFTQEPCVILPCHPALLSKGS